MDKQTFQITPTLHAGRKRYVISLRDPYNLPEGEFELPSPSQAPATPPQVNLLTVIIPPIIMIIGSVVVGMLQGKPNWALIAPMLIMSLGFPTANLISQSLQQKKYVQTMEVRKQNYITALRREKEKLEDMVRRQRLTLEQEYPSIEHLLDIALASGKNRRLWWRRPTDNDFLTIRLGTGNGKPTFTVKPPRVIDPNETLLQNAHELKGQYEKLTHIPLLLDLKRSGSLVVSSKTPTILYGYVRSLLMDVMIHHSPENVCVSVIADGVDAAQRWEWAKWMPHTRATYASETIRHLAFTKDNGNQFLLAIKKEYDSRKEKNKNQVETNRRVILPAYLIVMDDTGKFREQPDIAELAAYGYLVGIFLIFVGERGVPNVCRSRINITEPSSFRFIETWGAEKQEEVGGSFECLDVADCEKAARGLAGLEVSGSQLSYSLPDLVRLGDILGQHALELDTIKQTWTDNQVQARQMQFPVGIYIDREGPRILEFDFRSTDFGGSNEFHALAIGSTSSGKSIFLQSIVLATAQKYSPNQINFLLIDFKGGASELKKISTLPHVVGMVTDIDEASTERALQAIDTELRRRQILFDKIGSVKDIWDYNEKYPDKAIPQLLVVIDELAKGVEMMPDLVARLTDLGRRGRAIGLYYLVANQQVDHTIEKLIPNVSWYFVFKVKRADELRVIDRSLTEKDIPRGNGHGYMRIRSDVYQFQGAFSGLPVKTDSLEDNQEFTIARIEPDGRAITIHKHRPQKEVGPTGQKALSEQEQLCNMVTLATQQMHVPPARAIYLEALPTELSLDDIFNNTASYRQFTSPTWSEEANLQAKFTAPIGLIDIPEDCLQPSLSIDFKDKDGHVWVVGNPGSGKAMTVSTLLLSLAKTHRPDEVQFYILEYGSGSLRAFEGLPHTGAVIRLQEQERLERLIQYLDGVLEARTSGLEGDENNNTQIFVVINNFADLRRTYPDQADAFSRYIGSGKGAGIHLIITTNRGNDLSMALSSNIARRIVLEMATRDELLNVIGKNVPLLTGKSEGRGYWVDGCALECQVARPAQGENQLRALSDIVTRMQHSWDGEKPAPINILDSFIPFEDILPTLISSIAVGQEIRIPIGVAYDTLNLVQSNLLDEMPQWLILGPRQSGRSNLLMSIAFGAVRANLGAVDVSVFSPRRSPFHSLVNQHPQIKVLTTAEEMTAECQKLLSRAGAQNSPRYLLLIDDLGGVYDAGKEAVGQALNTLTSALPTLGDLFIIAAGLREDLQSQMGAPFIRQLRQSRTGIVLSKDMSDLEWLGAQISMTMRKMALFPGRGFYIHKGKTTLVQVPFVDPSLLIEVSEGQA